MGAYVVRRLAGLVPVLFGISLLVFSFVRLIPGDPAVVMLGERGSAEDVARVREQLGLNRPLFLDVQGAVSTGNPARLLDSQYFRFLSSTAAGDLGQSIFSRVSVAQELRSRWPATFELTVGAMLFAVVVGGLIGVVAALRRNSFADNATMAVALLGVSMPIFWLGILLVYLFAVNLRWLPPSGRLSVGGPDFEPVTGFFVLDGLLRGRPAVAGDALTHLILPSVALGTIPMAVIARMTRSAMIEVLSQDYVRTARAKGLVERSVVLKHALRNALMPVVTVIGLSFGTLLGGAVLTETIFSWPGIGAWIVEGIFQRDYPIVQGGVILVAAVFVLVNLIVDLLYAVLDPRIQYR